MLRSTCRWLLILVVGTTSVPGELAAGELRAGAATSNITPPLGGLIVGGFVPYPSEHIHDELHARCLVLDDGNTQLALVVCDLLGVGRSLSHAARQLIEQQTGIPPEQVLISATHTHSAVSALGGRDQSAEAPLDEYQQFVARRIADGVTRAKNLLRPAELAFGRVEVPEHLFNRRWYLRPGTMPPNPFGQLDLVKMNPPAGSPNLVEPAGPIDPEVSVLAVREPQGAMISIFSAYSLHYVGGVGAKDISADYYGVYCERLQQLLSQPQQDPPFVAMMANGTSADINNINFREPRGRKEPYEQIRYVANDIAEKVHALLPQLTYQRELTLGARFREPEIGRRELTPELQQWARETHAAGPKGASDLSYIYSERVLGMLEHTPTTTVPVQVLRIGDVCLGSLPCEILCEIGLEFKERAPSPASFMVSLNHGYFGYLPTPRQRDLGGYETWPGTNRLEREASVKLMQHLLEMAGELFPQPATE
jgi:hypothetical protein